MGRGALKISYRPNGCLAEPMRKLDEEQLNELVSNEGHTTPLTTQRRAAMRRRQLGRPATKLGYRVTGQTIKSYYILGSRTKLASWTAPGVCLLVLR